MFGIGRVIGSVASTAAEVVTLGEISPERTQVKKLINAGMDIYAIASMTGMSVEMVRSLSDE